MNLENAQATLTDHFAALSAERVGTPWPVFALEHPLSNEEREALAGTLFEDLLSGRPQARNWLAWVVIAAEQGYDYDGGVYWRPIEERSLPWDDTKRQALRRAFRKFQTTFNGVTPSGPWAESFSIIAWPITHAVLPRFLRLQFVECLYDLRYMLARAEALSAAAIGKLVADRAWGVSSRFREFLQQEELVGRLVLSILSEREVEAAESPIFIPTLERLVADLEQTHQAQQWLDITRRQVSGRFKGAAKIARTAPTASARAPHSAPDDPDVRATLMLRRSGDAAWSVVVELPSLAPVAALNTDFGAFVRQTRCKVRGAADMWLPRGWLATNAQRRRIDAWPGPEPLLVFEHPKPTLELLLAAETRLSTGAVWLCRVGADGLAREVRGRRIRPGQTYILLSESAVPPNPMAAACTVDCAGINATLLTTPRRFSYEDLAFIRALDLEAAISVSVWPAGAVVAAWDGEGYGEWLTTERPCFGLTNDQPVSAYRVRLDNEPEQTIPSSTPVTWLRLPPLVAGRHKLRIVAMCAGGAPELVGDIVLHAREPEPWIAGSALFNGFAADLEPADPSLDMFFAGSVSLNVRGPTGHQVTCAVELEAADGSTLRCDQVGVFDLPLVDAAWARRRNEFVKSDELLWASYEAAGGSLTIRGDELGQKRFRLERALQALHWVCRSDAGGYTVRALDETGADAPPTFAHYSLKQPARVQDLPPELARKGIPVAASGGLFVARQGDVRDAIVISASGVGALSDLAIEPQIAADVEAADLAEFYALWLMARAMSPLSAVRRGHVLMRLVEHFFGTLCGAQWAGAESRYLQSPGEQSLRDMERAVAPTPGFAVSLRRNHARMTEGTVAGAKWFADTARLYQVSEDADLCVFALRVASEPDHAMVITARDERAARLATLHGNAPLMRGARMVAVLHPERNVANAALPRWQWQ